MPKRVAQVACRGVDLVLWENPVLNHNLWAFCLRWRVKIGGKGPPLGLMVPSDRGVPSHKGVWLPLGFISCLSPVLGRYS